MTYRLILAASVAALSLVLGACSEGVRLDDPLPPTDDVPQGGESTESIDTGSVTDEPTESSTETATVERSAAEGQPDVFELARGCYAIEGYHGQRSAFLSLSGDGRSYRFLDASPGEAMPFLLQPADLGTYLLYDVGAHFLTARRPDTEEEESTAESTESIDMGPPESWAVVRTATLQSAERLGLDGFRSRGEWEIEEHVADASRFQARHGASDYYLGMEGHLVADPADAAVLTFFETGECASFPELSLDASGEVEPREWDDGDVFGVVDAHSHILTNKGFGGGGMFHGAPFHRLGVEHALHDCDATHGEEGRRDLIGFFYDGDLDLDIDVLLPMISSARTPEFNHHTEGFPTFTDWPNARTSSTHQVQYYRWIERAWRAGLRLVVELATGNSVLCEFMEGLGAQETLYSCNDMVGVDRAIESVREMERYIDALHGGPGQGWFRLVASPDEAREVIREGKLAVVLGIETSNLFNCFLSPPPGVEPCTPEDVTAALDDYHARGVRVVFPVHKYDNAFAPGDGHRGIIELGNLINSSHYSNFVEDCPFDRHVFDSGDVIFGGINEPRAQFNMPPVLNMFRFARNPIAALLPILDELQEPRIEGNFCQNAGLTPLGEHLLEELMARGMIIDVAHLPQHAVLDTFEIVEAASYPVSSTHGDGYGGRVVENGGYARISFGRCSDPDEPGTMGNSLRERVAMLEDKGLHPSAGFAFDFNGFAGGRGPRFGDNSSCPQPQPNPITYPFTSYAGDVEFSPPFVGDREIDYNNEGMVHIGLLPELIQDARNDGVSDEELEPLFRSAEGWIRMWELAEERAASF